MLSLSRKMRFNVGCLGYTTTSKAPKITHKGVLDVRNQELHAYQSALDKIRSQYSRNPPTKNSSATTTTKEELKKVRQEESAQSWNKWIRSVKEALEAKEKTSNSTTTTNQTDTRTPKDRLRALASLKKGTRKHSMLTRKSLASLNEQLKGCLHLENGTQENIEMAVERALQTPTNYNMGADEWVAWQQSQAANQSNISR